jgi:hypothetical protein
MNTKLSTSPAPTELELTLDFPTALRAVLDGARITKLEWADEDVYGVLRDGFLMLRKKDGLYYRWTLNDGDLLGKDWVVLGRTVH